MRSSHHDACVPANHMPINQRRRAFVYRTQKQREDLHWHKTHTRMYFQGASVTAGVVVVTIPMVFRLKAIGRIMARRRFAPGNQENIILPPGRIFSPVVSSPRSSIATASVPR